MAALVPKLFIQNDRRADFLVLIPPVHAAPEVHDCVPDHHPLGVDEGKTGAGLVETEQVKLLTQDAVVSRFGLLQPAQVIVKVRSRRPGGTVDALEHLLCWVAVPIGAGHGHNLTASDFARTGHVGPSAQVLEAISMRIERNNITAGPLDVVALILVAGQLFQGFSPAHFLANERPVCFDDLGHLPFNSLEIGRSDRLVEINVIVEPVFDRRTINQLRIRPNTANRLG